MKKIFTICLILMTIFTSCQQEVLIEDSTHIQTRSVNADTFTFRDDCFIVWDSKSYMLDYMIIGSSEVALDQPIDIKCGVYYTNGVQEDIVLLQIPAGSKSYYKERLELAENLETSYPYAISNITYIGYSYRGSMNIVGLEDLNGYPY